MEVGSADVNDLVISPQPTVSPRGVIESQGALSGTAKEKSIENIRVMLTADDDIIMIGNNGHAISKADGSFAMEKITQGRFRVLVVNPPEGAYAKSIRFGQQEVLGKTLDLTQASGGEIRIVLHSGAAEANGAVQTKQEGPNAANSSAIVPVTSAFILLFPEDVALNADTLHAGNTNQNGAFNIKGIAPGRYYALAYQADEYRNFSDPAILKQLVDKATKVEVKENDKPQLQLTLLPEEDLRKAPAAAGLDN